MSWTVVADLGLCQGHQVCRLEAPEVFGFDDGLDRVELLDAHPGDAHRACVETAVRYCPAMALSIEEDK